jgi:hypothetical protein
MTNNEKPIILFVVKAFHKDAPRSIRIKNIIPYLSKEFQIHILTMGEDNNEQYLYNGNIVIHAQRYSRFGILINLQESVRNKSVIDVKRKTHGYSLKGYIIKYISYLIKLCLYPDKFTVEQNNIYRRVALLDAKYKYSVIIALAKPHSIYTLGRKIKRNINGRKKLIYDIGDPLNNNSIPRHSLSKYLSGYYENKYLKYADSIVVTNNETREMYMREYKYLNSNKVTVIPQGGDNLYIKKKYRLNGGRLKMIYAGAFYPIIREPFNLYSAIENIKNIDLCLDVYGAIANTYNPPESLFDKKIHMKGAQSHQIIRKKYVEYDIIVFIDNSSGVQSPGKIYEILTTKVPILLIYSNDKSPTLQIVKENQLVTITRNTVKDIEKAILYIYNRYPEYSNVKVETNEYTWEKRSIQYSQLLRRLL